MVMAARRTEEMDNEMNEFHECREKEVSTLEEDAEEGDWGQQGCCCDCGCWKGGSGSDSPVVVRRRREKRRIIKNVMVISVAFFCTFTAFDSLTRLQSSLHDQEGLGVINVSISYAALVVSILFLSQLVITWIGAKWSMSLALVAFVLWQAANGFPVWTTMTTASVLLGLMSGPMWSAHSSYVTLTAHRYAQLTNQQPEKVVSKFFGIFYFFCRLASVLGSIVVMATLRPQNTDGYDVLQDSNIQKYCGLNDCPGNPRNETRITDPPQQQMLILLGVYISLGSLAVLLVGVFVDHLPDGPSCHAESNQSIGTSVTALIKQLGHRDQLLLLPITVYSGMHVATYAADFTKSFLSCTLGLWEVGAASIPFALGNTATTTSSRILVKYLGRPLVLITAFALDLAVQLTLNLWTPTQHRTYLLYLVATCWGLNEGIWRTQIQALYGGVFESDRDVAFTHNWLWSSVGYCLVFSYSHFLCTSTKLFILTSILSTSIITYIIMEALRWRRERSTSPRRRPTQIADDRQLTT